MKWRCLLQRHLHYFSSASLDNLHYGLVIDAKPEMIGIYLWRLEDFLMRTQP